MAKIALGPLLLSLAYVIAGGCAPPLPLDNRPCPCGTGFNCCAGICIRDGEMCDDPIGEAPVATVHTPMVRQGSAVMITLTGSDGTAPTTDLEFRVASHPGAPLSYDVSVPHGAPLGDVDVHFTARSGARISAKALFNVSETTVSPSGNDAGHGTRADPFRTCKKAISVASNGDTIQLLNDPAGYWCSTSEDPVWSVPDNAILQGESQTVTPLINVLEFSGNAQIKNLSLEARARVTEPGNVVKFDNVIFRAGLVVEEQAERAIVDLTGRTVLRSSQLPALLVQAPNVTVTILGGTSIDTGDNGTEAVRLEGRGAILDIFDSSINSSGSDALIDRGGGVFTGQNLEVSGALTFAHPESNATITGSKFHVSGIKGSSGIAFRGRSLKVQESIFFGMGISQDSADGFAVVRGCRFTEYLEPAYILSAGMLDLGNKDEPGNNMFTGRLSRAGIMAPALSIVAKPGTGWATSRATSFNGLVPSPASVMGPAKTREYEISDKVPISFY